MIKRNERSLEIQNLTGLEPRHFADLIRTAQIIADPSGGVSGRKLDVDWSVFGIPPRVAENLESLGIKYQYASPYIPIDIVWEQLIPEARSWLIDHKNNLAQIEEAFPALDED